MRIRGAQYLKTNIFKTDLYKKDNFRLYLSSEQSIQIITLRIVRIIKQNKPHANFCEINRVSRNGGHSIAPKTTSADAANASP